MAGLTFVALMFLPLGVSDAVEVNSGDGIMIIAAHPDDDVITSAGVIMDHFGSGEVTVAYLTNGDRCESQSQVDSGRCAELQPGIGTTRQDEAVEAERELGTVVGSDEDNLIFLGYPNGFLIDLWFPKTLPALFHTETYATYGIREPGASEGTDWHDYRMGPGDQHATYTGQNLLDDAEALIAEYKPDHIFTHTLWDRHQDHRTTYYVVVNAVKLVQDSDPTYQPYIHTTIVHVIDSAHCDPEVPPGCMWGDWPASADPTVPVSEYPYLEFDTNDELVWDQRESFEVPASMQEPYFSGNNPKAEAIEAHATQLVSDTFIRQFAHKDEIFWVEKLGSAKGMPDSYAVAEGGSMGTTGSGVLSNDVRGIGTPQGLGTGTNPLGPMFAVLVSGPDHASSFTLYADGSFDYTHNGDEAASDTFTYWPKQGTTEGSQTTVTITINPVNDAPNAVDDGYQVPRGDTLTVNASGVLGNDTDPENDSLNASPVLTPSHGALTLNSDGSFTYVHDGSAATSDSFTYKANDGQFDSNTATVSIGIDEAVIDPLSVGISGPAVGATGVAYTFTSAVLGGEGSHTYSWEATLSGAVVASDSAATFAFTADDPGSYVIRLTVAEGADSVVAETGIRAFGDISNSTFVADILWLADEGITQGCNPPANDAFCPDDRVTRGQMAAFLVRFLGLTDNGGGDLFTDDDSSIFRNDIDRLATAGITRGCNEDGTEFCPGAFVTRGQMAAFLVRALDLTDNGGGDLFTDDDSSIFAGDIDRLATAGITRGCNEDGTEFCPGAFVTRGQMAAFLHRAAG